jgi:hypothetical protein
MSSSSSELPITDKPMVKSKGLHPALYILNWIVFSNLTILFNKWLIDTAGFRKLPSLARFLAATFELPPVKPLRNIGLQALTSIS